MMNEFQNGTQKYWVVKYKVASGRNVYEAHITYLFLQVGTSSLKIFRPLWKKLGSSTIIQGRL